MADYNENEIIDEETAEWEDYIGYPFAMEAVNGEIISLTCEFQEEIKDKLLKKLKISEKKLKSFLVALSEDKVEEDERFDLISGFECDFFGEVLGFDFEEQSFEFSGIDFLESGYGWETKDLLEELGYKLTENVNYGPHGHGADGVVYVEK